MKPLANLLLVLGVCTGALGASGFHTPYAAQAESDTLAGEKGALPLFALGLVLLGAGGVLLRAQRRALTATEGGADAESRVYREEIDAIRTMVAKLDERKDELTPDELRARVGELLAEEYFDLTRKSDQLIALVGFSDYARVWDGVATAERLLARCWSMCTDGHPDEGKAELPLARAALDRAAEEAAKL